MKILQLLPNHSEVDVSFMEMHENLPPYFERSVPVVLFNILDFSFLSGQSNSNEVQSNLASDAESFIIFTPNTNLKLAQKVCAIMVETMLEPSVTVYFTRIIKTNPEHPDFNIDLETAIERTRAKYANQILSLDTVDDCSDFMVENQITLRGFIRAYQAHEKEFKVEAFANFIAKYGTTSDWILTVFKDFHIGNQFNH